MKYIKNYKFFEKIIIPDKLDNTTFSNYQDLVRYGNDNGFDVVNYDEFYDSLSEKDKKTAPPRYGQPIFALFHPIKKTPMFVLCDPNFMRIPIFKQILDDIIQHERIHSQQSNRMSIEYTLPNPNNRKEYFSNKDEVMAFSWTIANSLHKISRDIKDATDKLSDVKKGGMVQSEYFQLWKAITSVCDESIINRYRKYIYQYLEKMFSIEQ